MTKRLSKINNEEELAAIVLEYFSEFDIYPEVVKGDGTIADMVLVRDNMQVGVEVKVNFTFKLLQQGINNRDYFKYSYIVCPMASASTRIFQRKLCKDYGVGLLEIRKHGNGFEVKETVEPQEHLEPLGVDVEDWQKKSIPGTKDNRWTIFKETVYQITKQLTRVDGLDLDKAIEGASHHYCNAKLAKDLIRNYCQDGVIKDFRYENNKLYLTNIGRENFNNLYDKWEIQKQTLS